MISHLQIFYLIISERELPEVKNLKIVSFIFVFIDLYFLSYNKIKGLGNDET